MMMNHSVMYHGTSPTKWQVGSGDKEVPRYPTTSGSTAVRDCAVEELGSRTQF